jgi:DNA-binding transcriptional regulator PaaX
MAKRKEQKEIKSIRIKDGYSKGELTKEILKVIAMGGLVVASLALPNLPQVFSLLGVKTAKERFRIKRALRELEKQNFVDIYMKDEEEVMEITEKGKKRILQYQIDDIYIKRPKKWDGSWRMVMFDIPEKHKKARKALTRKLQEMEFYPLQKSVFLCPFDCKDEIDFVSEFFGVRKFIKHVVAKKIDDENYFKRHYNL